MTLTCCEVGRVRLRQSAWRDDIGLPKDMRLISDWSALFSESLGMVIDATEYQMGHRCRRFALLSQGDEVLWCGVEENADAESVLKAIKDLGWTKNQPTTTDNKKTDTTPSDADGDNPKGLPVRKGTLFPDNSSGHSGRLGLSSGSKAQPSLECLEEVSESSDTSATPLRIPTFSTGVPSQEFTPRTLRDPPRTA